MSLIILLLTINTKAADICNVCLDTPTPTTKMITGRGGSSMPMDADKVRVLDKPIFTGELFYELDNTDPKPLPKEKGVFFTISDKNTHTIKILGPSGKNWGKVKFDCSEYKYGSRISFSSYGFYGPGWKTFPLPKKNEKCEWHPNHPEGKTL